MAVELHRLPAAAGVGVVHEHGGLLGVDVQRGRESAEVPPVARRQQGQEADRCVLGASTRPPRNRLTGAPACAPDSRDASPIVIVVRQPRDVFWRASW